MAKEDIKKPVKLEAPVGDSDSVKPYPVLK